VSRPEITPADFDGLQLAVGTVTAIERRGSTDGLTIVRVRLDREVEALAPSVAAGKGLIGQRVVVATGLHRLRVGDGCITCLLLTTGRAGQESPIIVRTRAADGSRVY
jgi:hypothetical protein